MMTKQFLPLLPLAALAVIAACSPSSDVPEDGEPTPSPALEGTPEPVVTPTATSGGDGSEIQLQGLQPEDSAGLTGDEFCTFVEEETGDFILVASGVRTSDDPNDARLKVGDYVENYVSTERGFGSMLDGTSFSGRGFALTIVPGEPVESPEESYQQIDAQLLVQRADGGERTYEGMWSCGP